MWPGNTFGRVKSLRQVCSLQRQVAFLPLGCVDLSFVDTDPVRELSYRRPNGFPSRRAVLAFFFFLIVTLTLFSSFGVLLDPGGYISSCMYTMECPFSLVKFSVYCIEFGVQKYPTSTFTGLFFGLLNRVKEV